MGEGEGTPGGGSFCADALGCERFLWGAPLTFRKAAPENVQSSQYLTHMPTDTQNQYLQL